jgi:hypothetical protein
VRVIQTRVQDPLAEQIVAGTVQPGQTVVVDAAEGQLIIGPAGAPPAKAAPAATSAPTAAAPSSGSASAPSAAASAA